MTGTLTDILKSHLESPVHAWSIGISGAIGEFMYDENEAVELSYREKSTVLLSPRGGLEVVMDPEMVCVAHEELSSCTRSWSQNLSFCLPKEKAAMPVNHQISCLGEDSFALRESSKGQLLFDLGVGSSWTRFCVRTDNPQLIKDLQSSCGESVFDAKAPAGKAILEHSPTRVVISALGRVEVETAIPLSTGDVEQGPHTHLLPHLLQAKLPENRAIPDSLVECLALYPEHPMHDKYGGAHDFKQSSFNHFQSLLEQFGTRKYLEARDYWIAREKGERLEDVDDSSGLYEQVRRVTAVKSQIQETQC